MESDAAGLDLCRFIRKECSHATRIVLRTGQPGTAPEEQVLNEYDIDYYLEKGDLSVDRLFAVVRACLRSGQDISTLLAFGIQLRNFGRALQKVSSMDDLLVFMGEGLQFLELKHSAKTFFAYDLRDREACLSSPQKLASATDAVMSAAQGAHEGRSPLNRALQFGKLEHDVNGSFILFRVHLEGKDTEDAVAVNGVLYFEIAGSGSGLEKMVNDFVEDASLFIENWKLAYSILCFEKRLARERMLRAQMYYERLQSISTMVAGVAHELNTPLGVANTALSTMSSLVGSLENAGSSTSGELCRDVVSASELVKKNVVRALGLVKSFKQLSVSQLSDQKATFNLHEVVCDCVQSLSPELKKRKCEVRIVTPGRDGEGVRIEWIGYAGYFSQVIINLVQNALKYGYPRNENKGIDIRIFDSPDKIDFFRIECEDYGEGISPEVASRLFEPFVTTGRGQGGSGLGLAVSRNIIVNMLKGKIWCKSEPKKGALFVIDIPKAVPDEGSASSWGSEYMLQSINQVPKEARFA